MYPKWKEKPIQPSRSAQHDVIDVLNNGYDCSRSKRAKGTIERCLRRKNKIIKVVVVESYQYWRGDTII
ncbi:MAG: hypothetical protein ACE5J3_11395 [Methanosarcinales archaeon]